MDCKDKLPVALFKGNRAYEKELETMSPFEIKNTLIGFAEEHNRKSACLFMNAGRGNPNWIAPEAREAFFLLGKFGIEECKRVMHEEPGVAGIPEKAGIASRFELFIKNNIQDNGAHMLRETYKYFLENKNVDPDTLIHEWAEAIIGDQYPVPDRMLRFAEMIVNDYIKLEMCDDINYPLEFDLFATEGGTAGMCYVFDSLQENFLLSKGDHIALMTPIFTPYIEIPELERFDFKVTNIQASSMTENGLHSWQYPDSEIDKLKDKSIKLLCLVNPSNPPSYTLTKHTVDRIIEIVKNDNPNLMIVTDDVYGTFVPHFKSLFAHLPLNTLCVYSFSKYFGATGWRLAVIALHKDNIFDEQIKLLSEDKIKRLNHRYSSLTLEPEKIPFIDRMVADSRMVALNHTAGLSTPQQMQMSLFAAYSLLEKGERYKLKMQKIIKERLDSLWKTTGFILPEDTLRAGYYSEIDIMVWAKRLYGDEFATYLSTHYEPIGFLIRLAQESCVVLLNGSGFDGPEWSVRASLANLKEEEYLKIGEAIRTILEQYVCEWKASK